MILVQAMVRMQTGSTTLVTWLVPCLRSGTAIANPAVFEDLLQLAVLAERSVKRDWVRARSFLVARTLAPNLASP